MAPSEQETEELQHDRECPNCGGEMTGMSDDRYCLECIHEGRV